MKKILIMLALTLPLGAWAEIAVVVNPSSGIQSVDQELAKQLFLGKTKALPNGETAKLAGVDNDDISDAFNDKVLKKSGSQLRAYWARLTFTGAGKPPSLMNNSEALKSYIKDNPTAIGYMDAADVDDSVNVVLRVP